AGTYECELPRYERIGEEAVGTGLGDTLEPGVRPIVPAHLRRRTAVGHDGVSREVVLAANQRGAHAVRVDGHLVPLELLDLVDREPARGDDLHVLEAV